MAGTSDVALCFPVMTLMSAFVLQAQVNFADAVNESGLDCSKRLRCFGITYFHMSLDHVGSI